MQYTVYVFQTEVRLSRTVDTELAQDVRKRSYPCVCI